MSTENSNDGNHVLSIEEDTYKQISFRDLPAYDHNPFIESILSLKTKNKTVELSSRKNMLYTQGGEFLGDTAMIVKKKVDKEEFVKVFKNQLTLIFELTKTAQKVLTYFIRSLGVNKDLVLFDISKAKLYSGLTASSSIYVGLTELVQKNVIAKSRVVNVYYINPQILFNGNRLVVINAWEKINTLGPDALPEENEHENWNQFPSLE